LVNREVVIIEDIIDTGNTLHQFLPQIQNQQPASLKIAALLNKPTAMKYPINIDYLGFSVPDKFLLGFGLDYDGLGRNLPQIYQLVNE
jgi:hypoxanthine phosphoribosyltransferase